MRRILLLFTAAAMTAVVLGMSASPALADPFDDGPFDRPHFFFFDNDNGDFGPDFDDQELESGDIETETDISIEGSNNNQCVGLTQFGNTGNFANQQGTTQDGSGGFFFDDDDNHVELFGHDDNDDWFFGHDDDGEFEQEFEGPEVIFAPENETGCEQAVQQSSAASSWGW
jgi:hypothetical protein